MTDGVVGHVDGGIGQGLDQVLLIKGQFGACKDEEGNINPFCYKLILILIKLMGFSRLAIV